jgi:hypothetical protein
MRWFGGILAFVALLALWGAAGCRSDGVEEELPCGPTWPCHDAFTCVDGHCVALDPLSPDTQ